VSDWLKGLEYMKEELDSLQLELDYFNSSVTPETWIVSLKDVAKMLKVSVLREDLTELNEQVSSHKSLINDYDNLIERYNKAQADIIKRRRKLYIRRNNV